MLGQGGEERRRALARRLGARRCAELRRRVPERGRRGRGVQDLGVEVGGYGCEGLGLGDDVVGRDRAVEVPRAVQEGRLRGCRESALARLRRERERGRTTRESGRGSFRARPCLKARKMPCRAAVRGQRGRRARARAQSRERERQTHLGHLLELVDWVSLPTVRSRVPDGHPSVWQLLVERLLVDEAALLALAQPAPAAAPCSRPAIVGALQRGREERGGRGRER